MSRLIRRTSYDGKPHGWCHWCPACESPHCFSVEQPNSSNGARWTFNGDLEKPTFRPSMLIYTTTGRDKFEIYRTDKPKVGLRYLTEAEAVAALPNEKWAVRHVEAGRRTTLCHYHLKNGMLNYCPDSPHALAGKSVPLPEVPESWR